MRNMIISASKNPEPSTDKEIAKLSRVYPVIRSVTDSKTSQDGVYITF
jgi:hypothetical protein